jgi:mitochondrial fission protein ELM1
MPQPDDARNGEDMSHSDHSDCWTLSDGAAGNARQAEALARALGLVPRPIVVGTRAPWRWFAPHLAVGAARALHDGQRGILAPPWPALAIGCGRQAALATRLLRTASGGASFAVQILDPRIDPAHYDLVIAPRHDGVAGANVIRTLGALNPVDRDWLAAGRAAFADLAALPAPRTAILVGAGNHAQRLDAAYFDVLLERLADWHAADGGSFLATTSRRTPAAIVARLRTALARFPGRFWGGEADGENPYAGFLGWADRLLATPDSVNLICEACATGKPVYTFAPRPIGGKLAAFHAELVAGGHLCRLGEAPRQPRPPPLAETAAVADEVARHWQAAKARG